MPFFLIFLIALIGMAVLVFHISIEINTIEKRVMDFTETIRSHYEPENQPEA